MSLTEDSPVNNQNSDGLGMVSYLVQFFARLCGLITGAVSLNYAIKWSDRFDTSTPAAQAMTAAGLALIAAALAFGLAALGNSTRGEARENRREQP
jgi:hypothetical protein